MNLEILCKEIYFLMLAPTKRNMELEMYPKFSDIPCIAHIYKIISYKNSQKKGL